MRMKRSFFRNINANQSHMRLMILKSPKKVPLFQSKLVNRTWLLGEKKYRQLGPPMVFEISGSKILFFVAWDLVSRICDWYVFLCLCQSHMRLRKRSFAFEQRLFKLSMLIQVHYCWRFGTCWAISLMYNKTDRKCSVSRICDWRLPYQFSRYHCISFTTSSRSCVSSNQAVLTKFEVENTRRKRFFVLHGKMAVSYATDIYFFTFLSRMCDWRSCTIRFRTTP